MYKQNFHTRIICLILTFIMLFGMAAPGISAIDPDGGDVSVLPEETYSGDESVRVSIVLEDAPTIAVPYEVEGIASNADAMEYRHRLREMQELVVDNIETYALDGEELDVVWNLTLVANVISANVEYGKIEDIKALDGVADVYVEERVYLDVMDASDTVSPAMAGSSYMSGSSLAHAAGYTGAGSRVAIIDTGIDTDHRSFDEGAFEYSLRLLENEGLIHIDELDLMTAATIEGVLPELNIADKATDPEVLYRSSKLPFAYNYAEPGADVNHHSGQAAKDMEHGSHVAGIAAANTYVPSNEKPGEYLYAAEAVGVCGMAPDAQILTLRVFDKSGGAYESTYMVAIEDAIILGADSINLSLGSAVSGFNRASVYAGIMETLINSGTVCVASAGNNGAWADYGKINGSLLSEDVNFNTLGSPGSFRETFSVGSVDNYGVRQPYFTVDGKWICYTDADGDFDYLSSVAGTHEYVYLAGDAFADEADFSAIEDAVKNKIVVCQRGGGISLADKAENAAEAGAVAVVIVNNEEGTLDPVLDGYHGAGPVVTVTKTDGAFLKNSAEEVTGSDGSILYYEGTMTVSGDFDDYKSEYYTMSFFSSFGVPGNLSLAPDITAPGGKILSVNGYVEGGQAYETLSGTSMSGPQVAGMSATLAQYVRDLKLASTDHSPRFLIQNLLMSTSVPFKDSESGNYYPVFQQGSGLANLDRALNAQALILMDEEATPQYSDGKVKAEFGDDTDRLGVYVYEFTIQNFSGKDNTYELSTELFTQALKEDQLSSGQPVILHDTQTTPMESVVTYSIDGVPITAVTVKAYESVTVSVEICLSGDQKETLNASYPSGAYVEGYTFITGMADREGVRDVEYSIPLIGFYGNWSDASMYDHVSTIGGIYGGETLSYLYSYINDSSALRFPNNLIIEDSKTDERRTYTGNPYTLEKEFPEGKGAVRSTDTIYGYTVLPIRSMAAAAVFLTDENDKWIGIGPVKYQLEAASNYRGAWMSTTKDITFNRTAASMGLREGQVFNVKAVAVPEYYETDGNISADELRVWFEERTLGDGAYLSTTLTVDDTPPAILSVTEDEDGNITVTAEDNQYIAYMSITDRSGTVVYGSCVPHGEKGGQVSCTFDMKNVSIGPTCVIFVGDYAANSTTQYYMTKKTYPALEGKLGGYIHEGKGDYNKAWAVIDPQNGGSYSIKPVAYHGGESVTAAAYVDGYIYQVIGTRLYTSPANEIDYMTELVDLERFRLHSVYALSYNIEDHLLYALTEENTLWSIDPKNGNAERLAKITLTERTGTEGKITAMAIDGAGNFYGISYYDSHASQLLTWKITDISDNSLTPNVVTLSGTAIHDRFGSMVYSTEENVLYLAESYNNNTSYTNNRLFRIDPTAGTASTAANKLTYAVRGLFAVPTEDNDSTLEPTAQIEALDILPETLNMLVTGQEDISPLITPWTAQDKEIRWMTSDESVVTVEDGIITAQGVGTATVTVTVVSDPDVKDVCKITVTGIPSIQMSAIIYDTDRNGYLASYDVVSPDKLTERHPLPESYSFYAGGLSNGKLYVHDGYFMYTVDPKTYDVSQVMMFTYLDFAWSDVAQNPKGTPSFYEASGLYYSDGSRFGTYSRTLRAPISSLLPFDSPAVAVAYIDDDAVGSRYYVLLENGGLYRITFPSSPLKYEYLGIVQGVSLKDVSKVTRGISASMWYDKDTNYLVLSSRLKGGKAKVQLIDPETARVMSNTEFGEDIWYATALYQYDNNVASADKTVSAEMPSDIENAGEVPVSYAEESMQKETHSVYDGVAELLSAPPSRPYAAGASVARLESTGQTYSTLQAAVDAAHAEIVYKDHKPQTVTLLEDTNESIRDVWIRKSIDYNYELTLDLNGHTVKGTDGPVLWFESGGLGGADYGYHVTVTDSDKAGRGAITGGTGRETTLSGTVGGGIYFSSSSVNDSLTVSGGNIEGNSVTGSGGAVAMSGGSAAHLIISGGVIKGNAAKNGAVSGRWITVNGGVITDNEVTDVGGGIYMWGAGTKELEIGDGARVYGNKAGLMGDDVAAVSVRGGVTYNVSLGQSGGDEADGAWYADGADGAFDHGNIGQIERFDKDDPRELSSCEVTAVGRNAPAYGIAAKFVGSEEEEPDEAFPGDVDESGEVTAADALLLKKYLAGFISGDEINLRNADLNGDGKVNSVDLILLKKAISG